MFQSQNLWKTSAQSVNLMRRNAKIPGGVRFAKLRRSGVTKTNFTGSIKSSYVFIRPTASLNYCSALWICYRIDIKFSWGIDCCTTGEKMHQISRCIIEEHLRGGEQIYLLGAIFLTIPCLCWLAIRTYRFEIFCLPNHSSQCRHLPRNLQENSMMDFFAFRVPSSTGLQGPLEW